MSFQTSGLPKFTNPNLDLKVAARTAKQIKDLLPKDTIVLKNTGPYATMGGLKGLPRPEGPTSFIDYKA